MADKTRYLEQALEKKPLNLPSTNIAKCMYNDLKKYA